MKNILTKKIMDYLVAERKAGNITCEWRLTDKSLITHNNDGKRIITPLSKIL